jgi:3-oxoacyl-[acyl-carrier protein] reductase
MNEDRVAIVTGGTRGIGAAISLVLAQAGFLVLAAYRSNDERAAEFKKTLKKISSQSTVVKADVSSSDGVDTVVSFAVSRFGRIDVLVNNAGMFDFKTLEEMDESFFDKIMTVNFKSQVIMSKACVKYMKQNKFGRIINASSISSTIADVGLVGYGCSKAAVDMFTGIASAEFAPFNITVNAYAPGIIHTDLTDGMIKERGDIQKKQIPLLRFGKTDDVASLVKFLSSEEAGYITGQIIGVDGGMMKVQNPYRAHEDL